ncbi:MAG TPA: PPOX class F420-dependent oxidoreductase [Pseudonocardiaceae bacterium]|jgi:PPOX class probable F420-dependent enzyme|nr:PPOX class F420-dependent oxidoreductase [Pseudonocardiaceae bacterium]
MRVMSRDEWTAFVSAGTKTGKLAVVRRNGAPHVVPVWFVVDSDGTNDYVVFTTPGDSVKGRVLRREPRFGMCVDDENPPYSYVTFDAEATVSEDPEELLVWATKLGGRYMGVDAAEAFGKRNAVPGELLIRGRISKVTALAGIAD